LGIGTSAFTSPLSVRKDQAAATYITVDNVGTVSANTSAGFALAEGGSINGFFRTLRDGSGIVQLFNANNYPLTFGVNNSEQMRLTSTGLGIGTSSPAYKLDVNGRARLGSNVNTDSDSATILDGGNFVLAAASTQTYKTQFEIDGSITYINSNQYYNGGWQVYDSAKAPAGIWLSSANGDSSISLRTSNVNSGVSTEQMRIDSSGNVGIGQAANLTSKLTVKNSITFDRYGDATEGLTISTNSGNAVYNTFGGENHVFQTAGTERVRFDTSGNVGIGTSSPGYKLDVNGSARFGASGVDYYINYGANKDNYFTTGTTSGKQVFRNSVGTEYLTINSSGNVGIGTSSPSVRTEVSGTEAIVKLRVDTQNSGVSASNYSQVELSDNSAVRAYWRNVRDGSGQTQFAYNSFLAFLSDAAGTPTERMRIDASGNVGIGTSSPAQKLDVKGILQLTNSATPANTSYVYDGGGLLLASNNSNPMYFYTGAAERVRIDSSGNVGIGTSSPDVKLRIKGNNVAFKGQFVIDSADYAQITAYNGSTLYSQIVTEVGGSNVGMTLQTSTAAPLVFGTNSTERMRLDSSGNLLVGTTATINTNGVQIAKGGAAGGGIVQLFKTASGATNGLLNYYQSTYVGGINFDNTSTSLATSSDIRLKKDVVDAPSAINVTTSIRVVSHGWKHDEATVRYGFVAQELINVAPEAVMQGDDGEEVETTWTVDYARLVPMLIKSIQEQQALITSLTARITALEST
jgi:hypothetical protein